MLVKSPTINKFLLILIVTFLTACASDSSLYQYNFGRPVGITAEKVNKLQKGVTTSDDAISLFGKPDKESMRNSVIKLDWTESNTRGGGCALCKAVFDNKELKLEFDSSTKKLKEVDFRVDVGDQKYPPKLTR